MLGNVNTVHFHVPPVLNSASAFFQLAALAVQRCLLPHAGDLEIKRRTKQRGGGKCRGLNGDRGAHAADLDGDIYTLSGFTDEIERCRFF